MLLAATDGARPLPDDAVSDTVALGHRLQEALAGVEVEAVRYDGQPKDLLYRIYVKYLPLRQPA